MYSDANGTRFAGPAAITLAAVLLSAGANAEIVWNGHFNDHDFSNYHTNDDPNAVAFHLVPEYGRPPQYGFQYESHVGNGDLLSLVDSPTRGSNYSARFVVKSRAGGGKETADCDPASDCGNRRSQLQMTSTLLEYYNAIPQGAERWMSISFFIPEDYDGSGGGFGPVLWGSKSSSQNKPGAFGIWAENGEWQIIHRYYSRKMHEQGVDARASWWLSFEYSTGFPSADNWPQGLLDFPDIAASRAALANLNRGGWTDFIWHFKTDVDEFANNTGFLDVWMRAGSGEWVHVLKIRPMKNLARVAGWTETSPERVFDRGVGQYGPGGYTSQLGLYMDRNRVWDHDENMVIYMDNHKIGDENATFDEMSHDGSAPGKPAPTADVPPNPPVIVEND
jgi:Polysaccharide lyase